MGRADALGVLERGRYVAHLADHPSDLVAAQSLRQLAFQAAAPDQDRFDACCDHILIRDRNSTAVVGCFRAMVFPRGALIGRSYSAQFYGLEGLASFARPMMEIGRFCLHPGWRDPDILRLAWAAITRMVDACGAHMLFGCSSFPGTDGARYADAFAVLNARHLAPVHWMPSIKSPQIAPFAPAAGARAPDVVQAMRTLPPLLRSYLGMGGWVSDHAVIDASLNTLHVFTGLEIASIPPARVRALRLIAGGA